MFGLASQQLPASPVGCVSRAAGCGSVEVKPSRLEQVVQLIAGLVEHRSGGIRGDLSAVRWNLMESPRLGKSLFFSFRFFFIFFHATGWKGKSEKTKQAWP